MNKKKNKQTGHRWYHCCYHTKGKINDIRLLAIRELKFVANQSYLFLMSVSCLIYKIVDSTNNT